MRYHNMYTTYLHTLVECTRTTEYAKRLRNIMVCSIRVFTSNLLNTYFSGKVYYQQYNITRILWGSYIRKTYYTFLVDILPSGVCITYAVLRIYIYFCDMLP